MNENKILTPEEIAIKYVHGEHDALTDSQEKKDMAADIRAYAEYYAHAKESDVNTEKEALRLHDVMPRFWAVCYRDAQMVAIHKTEEGAKANCQEWNKSDDIYYVMPVRIHP